MNCPHCGGGRTRVGDSRVVERGGAVRRRRVCSDCGGRCTTYERPHRASPRVIKRDGRRDPFERDKLRRSVRIALRKRPVDPEKAETLVSSIAERLEAGGVSDVASETIGALVMEGLRALDDVAYVRFASVYKNFREARDFEEFVESLSVGESSRR